MRGSEVVAVVVVERAENRELVGHGGLLGKKLADLHAGDVRPDRPPDATVFGRRVGLEIVEIHVARTAIEPEEDHCRVLRRPASGSRRRFGTEDRRQPDRSHPRHADAEEIAARAPSASTPGSTGLDTQHRSAPRNGPVNPRATSAATPSAAQASQSIRGTAVPHAEISRRAMPLVAGDSPPASIAATTAIASVFSERAPAAGEPAAEEVHPLFERHGEPATDEIVELPVALAGEGSQGLTPVCGYLFFGSRHVRIRADGVRNVSWERGA